jgi:predicted nucleic acid-binding protein
MTGVAGGADLIAVVLADANVLYSRVLRDYLLYAADQEIIAVAWSSAILGEATEHLMRNLPGFDSAAAQRLMAAMNRAFPLAEVEPGEEQWQMLADVSLPDEDDRHVLAAALAAEATVLCTSNAKDIPSDAVSALGIEVLTPRRPAQPPRERVRTQMLTAHRTAVASLHGASDESTVAALRRAGAPTTAARMARLLGVE